ncbi:helix-turn-helix transcriptional regulator [Micromonospora sp. NBC_01699]|uniref:helix-turn-helix domain-containing protein n=1 Tax=Micromonospora sp. NBC_01699 TaxID=2975984 RepID=UPI002E30976F|nr:helix-turn-helix transcriptional regulator [Micromonospora sp. NBC_01699]
MNNLPAQLKQLRAKRAVTQDQVADAIQVSGSLIAAFETNRLIPKPDTAKALDGYFETGEEVQKAASEARKNRRPAPSWFLPWEKVEETASTLRYFQGTLIPGLLQTEAYAREVFARTGLHTDEKVASEVALRMERQAAILDREDRPTFIFILDAATLHCGPPEIAKEQLLHLADVGARPNIFIHVVPAYAALHGGRSGSISLANIEGGSMVGLLEDFFEDRVEVEPARVSSMDRLWHAIAAVALPCDQSRDLILRLVDDHDDSAADLA